jgi:Fur family ferric uptake transcriptional regulator
LSFLCDASGSHSVVGGSGEPSAGSVEVDSDPLDTYGCSIEKDSQLVRLATQSQEVLQVAPHHRLSTWLSRLSESGFRITTPRRAVIDVLLASPAAMTPEEMLESARLAHPGLGLATVYRTLQLFTDLGLVRRVHRQDGCHAYLSASPGHTHAVVCRSCGRGAEFPGIDDVRRLANRVEKSTGFHISDHLLQFVGLCPQCRQVTA